MKKYIVDASELVFYRIEVEAENQDEARLKAQDHLFTEKDIVDGENFDIFSIDEVND